MIDSKLFEDIIQRLSDAIPPGMRDLELDLQEKFRAILQGAFANFDLVTREEFDAQTKVLARTRAKLDALEQEITNLE